MKSLIASAVALSVIAAPAVAATTTATHPAKTKVHKAGLADSKVKTKTTKHTK